MRQRGWGLVIIKGEMLLPPPLTLCLLFARIRREKLDHTW